jgi:hypothetical protein
MVNNMDWGFGAVPDHAKRAAGPDAASQHATSPHLPPGEAQRQALVLRAAARVAPAPYGRKTLERILEHKDRLSWDMH